MKETCGLDWPVWINSTHIKNQCVFGQIDMDGQDSVYGFIDGANNFIDGYGNICKINDPLPDFMFRLTPTRRQQSSADLAPLMDVTLDFRDDHPNIISKADFIRYLVYPNPNCFNRTLFESVLTAAKIQWEQVPTPYNSAGPRYKVYLNEYTSYYSYMTYDELETWQVGNDITGYVVFDWHVQPCGAEPTTQAPIVTPQALEFSVIREIAAYDYIYDGPHVQNGAHGNTLKLFSLLTALALIA